MSSTVFIEHFVQELSKSLSAFHPNKENIPNPSQKCPKGCSRNQMFSDKPDFENVELNDQVFSFEMSVLDCAIHSTSDKFHRTICRMKPIFNQLLAIILKHPSDRALEKLLAFKKSIISIEAGYLNLKNSFLNESRQDY